MRFKELAGMVVKAVVIGAFIIGTYYGWIAASQLFGILSGPLNAHEGAQQIAFGVAGLTMAAYIGVKTLSYMEPTAGKPTDQDSSRH